jgi:hypothetical protein
MGQNSMITEISWLDIGFENPIETLFIEEQQELVIPFLTVMNNISHSIL